MENINQFNPSSISQHAFEYIIERRGYSDRNTLDLLNNTIQYYASKGQGVEFAIKEICFQLSLLTNITFEEWIEYLYPSNYEKHKTLRSILNRLQIYVPKTTQDEISLINIPVLSPLDSYKRLCSLEDRIDSSSHFLKWGLLAHFSDRGCIYSMMSLAHLMCPLSKSDPVIGPNTDIGHQLFSYSIGEIERSIDDAGMYHFTSKFQCMISEAYLKHGVFLSTTKHYNEGVNMIKYAYKIAPTYSRTRRYVKTKHPEIILVNN